jgi:uncharacterized protein YqgC (DUF456 family)
MEAAALALTILVLLAGLAGTLLPVVPGLPLMWLALLGYGWFTGWKAFGFAGLLVTGLLVLFSLVVDQAAAVLGAKKFGASRAGLCGSVAGGLLGYGWLTGWAAYGPAGLSVTGLLVLLSLVVDQAAAVIGAKKFGPSRAGLCGSVAGGLLGLIFFSLPGLVLGIFLGALALELLVSRRTPGEALTAGFGALLGFLAGSLFKFMLGLGLLGFFIASLLGSGG